MQADIHASAGNFIRAVEYFTRLAANTVYRQRALTGRAGASLMLGRYEEALRDVGEAIAIAATAESYFVRANIHLRVNQLRQCLEDCNRANELQPFMGEVLDTRAHVYDLLGMSSEAEVDRVLLEAIELLDYLSVSGVLVSSSPNGHNVELRGANAGNETMARISRLKPQIRMLLSSLSQ